MKMRKLFSVFAAAAFALSVVAGGCSKGKEPPPSEPAKKESVPIETKTAPKAGAKLFTGTIEALDAAAGTLTLKGPKGAMDFKADGRAKKDLDGMKIGDKVIVKHNGEMALSIVKPGAKKIVKTSKEKESLVKVVGSAPSAEQQ
jgi:hypothetical protein